MKHFIRDGNDLGSVVAAARNAGLSKEFCAGVRESYLNAVQRYREEFPENYNASIEQKLNYNERIKNYAAAVSSAYVLDRLQKEGEKLL